MENNNELSSSSGNAAIKIIAVFLVAGLVGMALWQLQKGAMVQKTVVTNTPTASITTTLSPSGKPTTVVTHYKNGTYEETGNYISPGGPEKVGVKITLTNGVVTDAIFTPEAIRPQSKINQAKFAAGFKTVVVGKPIDEINLTIVNGSSYTPKGFMDALNKIKKDASV